MAERKVSSGTAPRMATLSPTTKNGVLVTPAAIADS